AGISADGSVSFASGGLISFSAGGPIQVNAPVTARGGGAGIGGEVDLVTTGAPAAGTMDLESTVNVSGGDCGGIVNAVSAGNVILGAGSFLVANGGTGDTGQIFVASGGQIQGSAGGSGKMSAIGQAGGEVTLDAMGGGVNLGGPTG